MPADRPRFALMDSLRAIAALSVLLGHVRFIAQGHTQEPGPLGGLGAGVAIFFVISGFLLYRPFAAAHLRGEAGPRLRDFARRRALRIVPGYWFALTALAIFPGIAAVFSDRWWVHYGLLQHWFDQSRFKGLPQAWSLSVEACFYVMLPLLAWLGWLAARRLRPQRRLLAEGALLCLIFGAWAGYQLAPGHILATPLGYLDWFGAGMLLAVASAATAGRRLPAVLRFIQVHPALCWAAAAGAYCVFAFGDRSLQFSTTGHLLEGAFAVLVVLPAVFAPQPRTAVGRVLAYPGLAWLGVVSYGIFLWHVPILAELERRGVDGWLSLMAIGLPVTVACAAFSYYAVERPFLRLKGARSRARRGPAVGAGRPEPAPAR
jgi:peptidoglycan/LPS O-acetylase OafA/YrhL